LVRETGRERGVHKYSWPILSQVLQYAESGVMQLLSMLACRPTALHAGRFMVFLTLCSIENEGHMISINIKQCKTIQFQV